MTRRMPIYLESGHKIPRISEAEFEVALEQIAGRLLTTEEWDRAEEMASHNWTLRVVASELFGDALVDEFFAPKPLED